MMYEVFDSFIDVGSWYTHHFTGGEGVRPKMKETPILSGSAARAFWLHTLIHTPRAPTSCVRTDASSFAHYRSAKLARRSWR
jgi:hypothetical protein